MSGIPTNRSNITLPSEISAEIMEKVRGESAVMRLARGVTLPGRGLTIPMITGDPEAAWVAETDEKPVSNPSLSTKLMEAYTLAVIVPFSNQFRRDDRALYDALVDRLPGALALQFDKTVIGAVAKPGANMDNFAACTAQSLIASVGHSAYDGLVAAFLDIADAGHALDGFALSPTAQGILLGAVDSDGRPLFINSTADGVPSRILGAATYSSRGLYKSGQAAGDSSSGSPAVIGVAGDWRQAMYGTVEGVQISISDQATLTSGTTVINLWQRNMFAVRAEIEVGFRADTSAFNLLTGATPVA
ncbi:MAG: phage major capsid protein [Firmicutes bacterium]|nr:phage major capsid protein [Bacillota bacterium]